jgi:hypothetical protein
VLDRGVVASIGETTLWRWPADDAIRPWTHRSWIFPRYPDFAAKAGRILDLYEGVWNGQPLQADDFILSADEKTSIQARRRRHPGAGKAIPLLCCLSRDTTRRKQAPRVSLDGARLPGGGAQGVGEARPAAVLTRNFWPFPSTSPPGASRLSPILAGREEARKAFS